MNVTVSDEVRGCVYNGIDVDELCRILREAITADVSSVAVNVHHKRRTDKEKHLSAGVYGCGSVLRRLRLAVGLSRMDLACRVVGRRGDQFRNVMNPINGDLREEGCAIFSTTQIKAMEKGRVPIPRSWGPQFAEVLGCTIEELFQEGGAEDAENEGKDAHAG